jgi:hypothetical protein
MHARLTTIDSIYRILTENDVGDRISSLGKNGSQPNAWQKFTPAQLDQIRSIQSAAEDYANCWLARGERALKSVGRFLGCVGRTRLPQAHDADLGFCPNPLI